MSHGETDEDIQERIIRVYTMTQTIQMSFDKYEMVFFFLLKNCFEVLFYEHECFGYVYVCVVCACLVPKETRDRFGSHGTVGKDSYKLPYWC